MNGTCFLDGFLVKIEPYFFQGDILGSNFFSDDKLLKTSASN